LQLRTPRLILRRARAADADALHTVLSDPAAMRYWSTPPHATIDETRAWLADMITSVPPESDDFVVECEGRVIGKAGCWRLPEIGFILHPSAWGLGLASEAVRAVAAHVFAAYDIAEITADVDPRNAASLALLAKLGFVETGRARATFVVAGEPVDSVYLALPRPAP
jgi:RimJ/RimL family protein N-acetyltransferase